MFFDGISPKEDKCCGCEGCKSICPKSAIDITTDSNGFIIPNVNMDLCVDCGLCEKVCPMYHSHKVVSDSEGTAYAAVSKDIFELSQSSSGGVFSLIAELILDNGGYVCGASFDNNLQLLHVITDDSNHLSSLRGSKYLQSRLGGTYKEIKKVLETGKAVYFVGTGCQVAGLRLFLRKEYTNLITSDILCHGVPPQSVFNEMIKLVESKYDGKILKYNFRDKSVWGWSCSSSSSSVAIGNKVKYLGNDPLQMAYFNAFIKADNYRESCYVCPYAQSKRAGDITLGDFWGVEKYISIKEARKGVSAILVNTSKGAEILEKIKDEITLHTASIRDIEKINQTLVQPTPRPHARDCFFEDFKKNPESTLMKYYRPSSKRDLVYALKRNPITSKMIILVKRMFGR